MNMSTVEIRLSLASYLFDNPVAVLLSLETNLAHEVAGYVCSGKIKRGMRDAFIRFLKN
jgi:hypothetical protein